MQLVAVIPHVFALDSVEDFLFVSATMLLSSVGRRKGGNLRARKDKNERCFANIHSKDAARDELIFS